MVTPPTVYLAGLLRGMKRGVDTDAWIWVSYLAGQRIFFPPDVAGWQEDRWLDTSTWRGRWFIALRAAETKMLEVDKDTADPDESAATAVDRALAFWGRPGISQATRSALERFADRCVKETPQRRKEESVLLRQNALRMMVATSPDLQTC
jgi:hypothetical protein